MKINIPVSCKKIWALVLLFVSILLASKPAICEVTVNYSDTVKFILDKLDSVGGPYTYSIDGCVVKKISPDYRIEFLNLSMGNIVFRREGNGMSIFDKVYVEGIDVYQYYIFNKKISDSPSHSNFLELSLFYHGGGLEHDKAKIDENINRMGKAFHNLNNICVERKTKNTDNLFK